MGLETIFRNFWTGLIHNKFLICQNSCIYELIKNRQILITRPFFVVASQFVYQRAQGEKAHPMAPLSGVCVGAIILLSRNQVLGSIT